MKMRIFIIKNGFIVFQSILQHDLYMIYTMRSNHLSKHFFHSDWQQLQNMVFERFNTHFFLDMLE